MSGILAILFWPLLACVSMALLHGYCGLHVLRRGVIFVDLALAQMAALGAVVGLVVAPQHAAQTHAGVAVKVPARPGPHRAEEELADAIARASPAQAPVPPDPDEPHAHPLLEFWPTFFALGGAVLLAFGRLPGGRIPHEAMIGIVYVVAAAATVLILSKAPHGHERMEAMLTGKLLFVDRDEVISTAALYAGLGLLHWLSRRPFLAISASAEEAERAGVRVRFWDCLFYAMFALMVTRSVAVAGVLVVFSFLIIPGACAALYVASFRAQMLLAWLIAVAVSFAALAISAAADLPTGSTLVATFGGALLICLAGRPLIRRRAAVRTNVCPPFTKGP